MAKKQKTKDKKVDNKKVDKNQKNKNKPVKKKRRGCLGCLITSLVLIVVIGVAGFFVGDHFSKQYLGMGLIDAFKVLGDLKDSDSSVVTNGYSGEDEVNANTAIKQALFIKPSADVEISDVISAIVNGEETVSGEQGAITYGIKYLSSSNESKNAVVDVIDDFLTEENIDFDRISGYNSSRHDSDYTLKLTDKQVAALINGALDKILGKDGIVDALEDLGIDDIRSVVSFDQIIIGDGTITATVSIATQKTANTAIKQAIGKDLSFLTKLFLPKRFYLTLTTDLDFENVKIKINKMNDAAMNRAFKLVENVSSLTGNSIDVQKLISEKLQDVAKPMVDKVRGYLPSDGLKDGQFKIDVWKTIVDVALNKGKEDSKKVTAQELIQSLSYMSQSNATNAIKGDHASENQYYDSATDKVVYKPVVIADTMTLMNYQNEFMKEIAKKYSLRLSETTGMPIVYESDGLGGTVPREVSFDDMMVLFGLKGGDVSFELMDLFDAKNLSNAGERVKISDRMLGAIMNAQIEQLTSGDGLIKDMTPKVEYLIMHLRDGRNVLELGLSADVVSSLGDDVKKLVESFMGEKIIFIIEIDVTLDLLEGQQYLDTDLSYNDLGVERTELLLSTIAKIGVDINFDSVISEIETPVRDVIKSMNELLNIDLKDSISNIDLDATRKNLPPAIELPNVYEMIDVMLFSNETGDDVITPDSIERVFDKLLGDYTPVGSAVAEDYSALIEELEDDYYFVAPQDFNPNSFEDLFSIVDVEKFDVANFNLDGTADGEGSDITDGLFYDTRSAGEQGFAPVISEGEIALLIQQQLDDEANVQFSGFGDVVAVEISNEKIMLTVKMDASSYLNGKENFLPKNEFYVIATIDTKNVLKDGSDNPYAYSVEVTCNGMTTSQEDGISDFEIMQKMIETLSGELDNLNIESIKENIGKTVYEKLDELSDLGGITFVDGGIQLPGIYSFLKKVLIPDDTEHSEGDVQAALQGLYAKKGNSSSNNYVYSEIVINEIPTVQPSVTVDFKDTGAEVTLTDKHLGYGLQHGLSVDINGDGDDDDLGEQIIKPISDVNTESAELFTLKQVNVIAKTDTVLRLKLQELFANRGIAYSEDKNYLELTFALDISSDHDAENAISAIVPNELYVTFYVSHQSLGNDNSNYEIEDLYVINSLTDSQQKLLETLIGLNISSIIEQEETGITAELNDDVAVDDNMFEPLATDKYGIDGIGKVTIPLDVSNIELPF